MDKLEKCLSKKLSSKESEKIWAAIEEDVKNLFFNFDCCQDSMLLAKTVLQTENIYILNKVDAIFCQFMAVWYPDVPYFFSEKAFYFLQNDLSELKMLAHITIGNVPYQLLLLTDITREWFFKRCSSYKLGDDVANKFVKALLHSEGCKLGYHSAKFLLEKVSKKVIHSSDVYKHCMLSLKSAKKNNIKSRFEIDVLKALAIFAKDEMLRLNKEAEVIERKNKELIITNCLNILDTDSDIEIKSLRLEIKLAYDYDAAYFYNKTTYLPFNF